MLEELKTLKEGLAAEWRDLAGMQIRISILQDMVEELIRSAQHRNGADSTVADSGSVSENTPNE